MPEERDGMAQEGHAYKNSKGRQLTEWVPMPSDQFPVFWWLRASLLQLNLGPA